MTVEAKLANKPRCPVCMNPLDIWVSGADVIHAKCPECGWDWLGG